MWEYPDILAMLCGEETGSGAIAGAPGPAIDRGPTMLTEPDLPIFGSPQSFGDDRYIIDPDYFDMLGLTDPDQLIRYK